MLVYIWNTELINNNYIIFSCLSLKNFTTFTIHLTINPDDNNINYNINNNGININYYLFNNTNNQRVLLEYQESNLLLVDVLQGNYELIAINDYRENNIYNNLLDNMVWLNILGRIELI